MRNEEAYRSVITSHYCPYNHAGIVLKIELFDLLFLLPIWISMKPFSSLKLPKIYLPLSWLQFLTTEIFLFKGFLSSTYFFLLLIFLSFFPSIFFPFIYFYLTIINWFYNLLLIFYFVSQKEILNILVRCSSLLHLCFLFSPGEGSL